jgi:hypothetical protein
MKSGRIAQFVLRQNLSLKHFLPRSIPRSAYGAPRKNCKAKAWIAHQVIFVLCGGFQGSLSLLALLNSFEE